MQDDDPHADVSLSMALDILDEYDGDIYVKPERAREVCAGLYGELEDALDTDHPAMMEQDGSLWLNRYVAEVAYLAKDARGKPAVPQYDPVVSMGELSTTLCEDLGVEVGSGHSVGHARNLREKHDENVQNLREHFAPPEAEQ